MSFTILYGNFVRKSFWSAIFESQGVMMRGVRCGEDLGQADREKRRPEKRQNERKYENEF